MRAAIVFVLAAFAFAPPAVGQPLPPPGAGSLAAQMDVQLRLDALQAQQDMAQREAVIRDTQLMNLEAQLRARDAIADVQARGQSPRLPPPPASGPMPHIDVAGLASIPDAALAESEARVRAAAKNRR